MTVIGHTVRKAWHWVATIYCLIVLAILVCAVVAGLIWCLVKILQAMSPYWGAWLIAIGVFVFNWCALSTVERKGVAWKVDLSSDEHRLEGEST